MRHADVAAFPPQTNRTGSSAVAPPASPNDTPRAPPATTLPSPPAASQQPSQLLQPDGNVPVRSASRSRLAAMASKRLVGGGLTLEPPGAAAHRRSRRHAPPRSNHARSPPPRPLLPRPPRSMGRTPRTRFFQLFFCVPVGFVERPGRLTQVVEVAQLVRHPWQFLGDRLADRFLAIGDDPARHRQGVAQFRPRREGGRDPWWEPIASFWPGVSRPRGEATAHLQNLAVADVGPQAITDGEVMTRLSPSAAAAGAGGRRWPRPGVHHNAQASW